MVYLLVIRFQADNEFHGDGYRHFEYAQHLVKGYYTQADEPSLINGPGYPMFLAPFVGMGLPIKTAKYANALLLYFSVVVFFATLILSVPHRLALFASYALGLYLPVFKDMVKLHAEPLALLLISGFLFLTVKYLNDRSLKAGWAIGAGLLLGLIAMTKIIFGYVIFSLVVFAGIFWLVKRNWVTSRILLITVIGLLGTLPYLLYTYQLTGRTFYWGTNGGEQLYWMTSRNEHEFGNWINPYRIANGEFPDLAPEHLPVVERASQLSPMASNDYYLSQAKANIAAQPKDYLLNVMTNGLRLFFGYPYSYQYHTMGVYAYLFFNGPLLLLLLVSFIAGYYNWRRIPPEVYFFAGISFIYLGGTLLVAAVPRYLIPVVPILGYGVAVICARFVRIRWDFQSENRTEAYEINEHRRRPAPIYQVGSFFKSHKARS